MPAKLLATLKAPSQASLAPDDHQRRRTNLMLRHQLRQVSQGAGKHPLVHRGALLDQRRRRIRRTAVLDHLLADHRQAHQAHVEHHGLCRRHQVDPRQIGAAILQVTGDKTHGLRIVTVSQWNPGVG